MKFCTTTNCPVASFHVLQRRSLFVQKTAACLMFVSVMLSRCRIFIALYNKSSSSLICQQIRSISRLDKRWKDISNANKQNPKQIFEEQRFATTENDFLLSVLLGKQEEKLKLVNSVETHVLTSSLIQVINEKKSLEEDDTLPIIKKFEEKRQEIPDDDLISIMEALASVPSADRGSNYLEVCRIMDAIMTSRLASPADDSRFTDRNFCWNLVVAWYKVFKMRSSIFLITFATRLLKDAQDLDKSNFLRLLFLLNLRRSPLTDDQLKVLQHKFQTYLKDLSTEEVALASLSFFKTQSKIKDPLLVESMLQKLVKDAKNVNPIAFSGILKNLKYGMVGSISSQVRKFIESWTKDQVLSLNYMAANNLLKVSCNYLQFNKDIADACLELITKKPHGDVRLKDTVEILRSLDEFNYKPKESIMDKLVMDVSSSPELYVYPYYFLSFLTTIACFEKYPHELIEKCFQDSFLRLVQEGTEFPVHRYLLNLYSILSIECHPKYEGKLLSEQQVSSLTASLKRMEVFKLESFPKPNVGDLYKFSLQQMFHQAKIAFGDDQVIYSFLLPYTLYPFIVLLPEGKDVNWINSRSLKPNSLTGAQVFNVMNVSHFSDTANTRYRNYYATQVRLLQKMGVVVHNFHWSDLRRVSKEFAVKLQKISLKNRN